MVIPRGISWAYIFRNKTDLRWRWNFTGPGRLPSVAEHPVGQCGEVMNTLCFWELQTDWTGRVISFCVSEEQDTGSQNSIVDTSPPVSKL